MRDLSKEDQERINDGVTVTVGVNLKKVEETAYKEGFNEAIDEIYNLLKSKPQFKIEDYEFCTINIRSFFEEIEKLKK